MGNNIIVFVMSTANAADHAMHAVHELHAERAVHECTYYKTWRGPAQYIGSQPHASCNLSSLSSSNGIVRVYGTMRELPMLGSIHFTIVKWPFMQCNTCMPCVAGERCLNFHFHNNNNNKNCYLWSPYSVSIIEYSGIKYNHRNQCKSYEAS